MVSIHDCTPPIGSLPPGGCLAPSSIRKGGLQGLPRETGQRRRPRAVDDLDTRHRRFELGELRRPLVDAAGVPQAFRVVAVPVGLAAGLLAVVAQQQDAPRASLGRQRDGAGAAVAERPEWLRDSPDSPVKIVARVGLPQEVPAHLLDVPLPPLRINGEKAIRPAGQPEGGVGDAYARRSFPGRSAPPADLFAVVCGEAGAAGEADDGCALPASSKGTSRITFVSYRSTAPACR